MGIALLTFSTLLQRLLQQLLRRKRSATASAPQTPRHHRTSPGCVRIFRPSTCTANEARLAIAGRMADVCAELDRLAAHEKA